MGNNRKKNVARIQQDAVWYPKFTPAQARAVWEVFGSNEALCKQISKDDFIKAATKGHLRLEKHLQIVERLKKGNSPILGCIHVSIGLGGYENLGLYHRPKGENLYGKRILCIIPEVFKNTALYSKEVPYRNTKGLTHVTWFEKMLGLIVES
jgi:hypothetical protein